MTLTPAQRDEAARLLREAEHHTSPIAPLSSLFPALDVSDAYAVQQSNITRRLRDGATVIGHKVGLTSAAMQRLLGVAEPDFGHLLDDMTPPHGRHREPYGQRDHDLRGCCRAGCRCGERRGP